MRIRNTGAVCRWRRGRDGSTPCWIPATPRTTFPSLPVSQVSQSFDLLCECTRFFCIPVPMFRIRIHWVRIRIPHFRLNTVPDPGPIWTKGFDDQELKKITIEKKKLIFFWLKIAINLSLKPQKGRPSYRRSLQPWYENIQHFKTWNFLTFFDFCGSFLPSWIRILIRNTALYREH